jgi:ribose 5-phosphate isomerase A
MTVKNTQSNPETKRLAGTAAARLVQDGMLAGIGTGSTVFFLIEELGRRVRDENLKITAVPTSFQSRLLCMKLGISVRDMQDVASLDLALDGADEVDPDLNLIKGGGAAQAREKIVVAMAKEFVVVVDESKLVRRLGQGFAIPVEILPSGLALVEKTVAGLGGTSALRLGVAKDGPVVTDNGQFLLDVRFPPSVDLRTVDQVLHQTPGVVETGLFFRMASKALVGCGSPGNLTLRTLERPEA